MTNSRAKSQKPKPWPCGTCQKLFDTKQHLGDHNRSMHLGIRPFQCEQCPATFKTETGKRQHYLRIHTKKRPHSCSTCGKRFFEPAELRTHLLTHLDKSARPRPWKCDSCDKSFFQKAHLLDHIRNKHLSIRPFQCELCPANFKTSTTKRMHLIRVHTNERPHLCSYPNCGKSFVVFSVRMNHEKTHNVPPRDRATHNCPHCEKRFVEKRSLTGHILVVHENSGFTCPHPGCSSTTRFNARTLHRHVMNYHRASELHKCSGEADEGGKCSQKFNVKEELVCHLISCHEEAKGENWLECPLCKITVFSLKEHLATKHGDREPSRGYAKLKRLYSCKNCSKSFTSNHHFKNHYILNHDENSNKTKFECSKCGKSFFVKSQLRVHTRYHHPMVQPQPRLPCPFCPATLVCRGSLFRHLRTHTGERPYKCEDCHKSFADVGYLKIHKERLHNISGGPECYCPICKVLVRNKHVLRTHIRSNHEESNGKQFTCYFCFKPFSILSSLHQHLAVHTKEEPYKCGTCFKSFNAVNSLTEHKIRHSGIRAQGCYFCGKHFYTIASLKCHLRIHTLEKVARKHKLMFGELV